MESRSVGEELGRRIQKRSMDSGLIESVGAFIYCVKTRRYLFLLRNNTKYAGTWGVVGGKVEANEQIIESLSREIEEELTRLDEILEKAENDFKSVNLELKEVLDSLDDKYPQGRINLQDGTVQYQVGALSRKQIAEQQAQQAQQPATGGMKVVKE